MPLPHWTEPPTGEVPIILPESETIDDPGADDDLDALVGRLHRGTALPVGRRRLGRRRLLRPGRAEGRRARARRARAEGRRRRRVRQERRAAPSPPAADPHRRRHDRRPTTAAPRPRPARPRRPPRSRRAPTRPARCRSSRSRRARAGPSRSRCRRHGVTGATLPPGSDLLTRVVVGVVIAVAALICLNFGRGSTAVLATVIVGVAAFEFYEALRKRGFHPATILGLLAAVTTPLAAYKVGESALPADARAAHRVQPALVPVRRRRGARGRERRGHGVRLRVHRHPRRLRRAAARVAERRRAHPRCGAVRGRVRRVRLPGRLVARQDAADGEGVAEQDARGAARRDDRVDRGRGA